MKMKNIIIYGLGALILVSSASCEKRFDEMNVSPNNPEDAPSQLLLANVIASSAYRYQLTTGLVVTDLWMQHTKANTYMNEDQYSPRADRLDVIWSNAYSVIFSDCLQAIKTANEKGQKNNEAVGYILKANTGYNLTTLYGDIPYSEAGDPQQFTLPKYDAQAIVLQEILADLNKAIDLIGSTTSASVGLEALNIYDYIYHGNMQKWKKFANGLKLRVYLTLTSGGIDKTSEINALLSSADVMQSNDDNASMPYLTSKNPVNQWITSSRKNDFKISNTMVNYLMGSSADSALPADKRLTVFADTVKGKYLGGQNGDNPSNPSGFSPLSTKGFYNSTSAYRFMTYAEVLFIAAEMDTTNASKYEAAVKASFLELGLTEADAIAALADPHFAFDPAHGGKLIGEQKWVALFGQSIEAFNSWRRTGYPKLIPAKLAATAGSVVPRRLFYNTTERNLNESNSAAAVGNLSPAADIITAKVWFDRNHPVNFGNK
jgi:hypothetical protein